MRAMCKRGFPGASNRQETWLIWSAIFGRSESPSVECSRSNFGNRSRWQWHQICFPRVTAVAFRVLKVNATLTLVGYFELSSREKEKRDRRDSRGDESKGKKRNWNEREETEEIKTFPSTLTCYKDKKPCPTVSQYQLDSFLMKDTWHLCHPHHATPLPTGVKPATEPLRLAICACSHIWM